MTTQLSLGQLAPLYPPLTPRMSQELGVLLSSETGEWYTPSFFTDLARQVMGNIDLDPASNFTANRWIKADAIYTKEDNGLRFPWFGRVWVNPPYCKTAGISNQEIWANKLIAEYEAGRVSEAILLVKAALGYGWFKSLFKSWPCCLTYDLISFISADRPNEKPKPSKLGSAFFYFGPNFDRFEAVFEPIGKIIPGGKP